MVIHDFFFINKSLPLTFFLINGFTNLNGLHFFLIVFLFNKINYFNAAVMVSFKTFILVDSFKVLFDLYDLVFLKIILLIDEINFYPI